MREAIDSALAQTYGNFEVIAVNDGSNDGDATREIALSYGDKIRYFEKENGGVATALNLAVEKMEGEYFSWLSHDDLYYPNKLTAQIEALRKRGDWTAIVYSGFDYLDMVSGEKWPAGLGQYPLERLEHSVFPILYGLVHGCSLLIHRSHFERVGVFDKTLLTSQDYDLWFRMFRGQRLLFVPQPLICARIHPEQGTNTMECYEEESNRFFFNAALSLSEEEVYSVFCHPFLLYHKIGRHFCEPGGTEAYETLRERYGPKTLSEAARRRIQDWLDKQGKWSRICIFCAGMYGKRMRFTLLELGLSVNYFSDNNPALWGEAVDGTPCISPDELQKISGETLVLVSLLSPEPVLKQLKRLGCPYVMTKQQFERELFDLLAENSGNME